MIAGATISECGTFRTDLWRIWNSVRPTLVFAMLNPSTADGTADDPTIRKCIGFATRARFGSIRVVNLSAYRATQPAALFAWPEFADELTPENECAITRAFAGETVVLAWGAHARRLPRCAARVTRLADAYASRVCWLDRLADGTPAHPLMLPYDAARRPRGTL